jgi:hypothetical protein
MAFTHIDLIGLNKYEMQDAPIVGDDAELIALAETSKAAYQSISIAGMRHSQGGHTALEGGRMVFTEAMQGEIELIPPIEVKSDDRKIKVDAGVTWDAIHHYLGPMGLAPFVHQSSSGFTVGGSLSVDCHGREVDEGAISNTVESITVLTNHKDQGLRPTFASRDVKPELFFATLGGYGACGVILNATIRVTENTMMRKYGTYTKSLDELQDHLTTASKGIRKASGPDQRIEMFYAWLNVSKDPNKYLCESMVYEYMRNPDQHSKVMRTQDIKEEKWAASEAMKLAWEAGRVNPKIRAQLFELIRKNTQKDPKGHSHRINYLREETSFLGTKGGKTDVDILQEFFLPLSNITKFLAQFKKQIPHDDPVIDVLSCTLRIVRSPKDSKLKPYLSYQSNAKSMVSVALEIKVNKKNVSTDKNKINYKIADKVVAELQTIIDIAINLEGFYYLPYYQIATVKQFKAAYPNSTEWKKQADIWNPILPKNKNRLFNNEFLKAYLDKLD